MPEPASPAGSPLRAIDRELGSILYAPVIHGLDAVRALAIILVLTDHYQVTDHLFGRHPELGALGVMIFFVLSGFLITGLLLREYERTGRISLSNFYRRRAYRIFPAFYVCWILATLVDIAFRQFHWEGAAASFFYMMDYARALRFSNPAYSQMWISWSLAVEEKFYLLWPLLLLTLLRKRTRVARTVALIILGLWAYRAFLHHAAGVSWGYLYCAFEMRVDALLTGCVLALLLHDPKTRVACSRLLLWPWLSLLSPLALAWAVLAPSANPALHLLFWSIEPPIIAVMLLQAVYWGQREWTFCRNKIVRAVALLSYSLYLYHPLGSRIIYLLHIPHNGLASAVLVPVLTVASYRFVERPFMSMRDRSRPAKAREVVPVPSAAV
jgi:peptidoglycan/LPS O-acetylase OafA/YrhL